MIYLDLDGVLCDMFGEAGELINVDLSDRTKWASSRVAVWNAVNKIGLGFWSNMTWTKDGRELWKYVKKQPVTIISGYPSEVGNKAQAKVGKLLWVLNNLDDAFVMSAVICHVSEKQLLAKEGDILIDDNLGTIRQWNAKGGIGIRHINAATTIKALKELGL
jgi:hypothetical protein